MNKFIPFISILLYLTLTGCAAAEVSESRTAFITSHAQ